MRNRAFQFGRRPHMAGQSKNLAPYLAPQCMGKAAHRPHLAVAADIHALDLVIDHQHRQFRVAAAQKAAVVDVGAAQNGVAVIDDQQLAVHIHLLGDMAVADFCPIAQIQQGHVLEARLDGNAFIFMVVVVARAFGMRVFFFAQLLFPERAPYPVEQTFTAVHQGLHRPVDLGHDGAVVQGAFGMHRQGDDHVYRMLERVLDRFVDALRQRGADLVLRQLGVGGMVACHARGGEVCAGGLVHSPLDCIGQLAGA